MLFAVVHLGVDCIRVVIARQDVPLVLFFFLCVCLPCCSFSFHARRGLNRKKKKTHKKKRTRFLCLFFTYLLYVKTYNVDSNKTF